MHFLFWPSEISRKSSFGRQVKKKDCLLNVQYNVSQLRDYKRNHFSFESVGNFLCSLVLFLHILFLFSKFIFEFR